MNLHMPQSIQASMEIETLCRVPYQIISPQGNKPCIGIVQDSIVGSYILVQDDVLFTKRQMMSLLSWNETFDGTLPKPAGENGLWTGRQVFLIYFTTKY